MKPISASRVIGHVYTYDGGTVENVLWKGNHYDFIGGKGQLRALPIQDETFEQEAKNRSKLQGLDADHELTGVTFENLVIAGKKRLDAQEARVEISRHVKNVTFK